MATCLYREYKDTGCRASVIPYPGHESSDTYSRYAAALYSQSTFTSCNSLIVRDVGKSPVVTTSSTGTVRLRGRIDCYAATRSELEPTYHSSRLPPVRGNVALAVFEA